MTETKRFVDLTDAEIKNLTKDQVFEYIDLEFKRLPSLTNLLAWNIFCSIMDRYNKVIGRYEDRSDLEEESHLDVMWCVIIFSLLVVIITSFIIGNCI